MMQEILKPLLESDVLTDDVKESIELALTEAIVSRENAIRAEMEKTAKESFEKAKEKFEELHETLKESYKVKLDEATIEIDLLESKVEELEARPYINVTDADLDKAEKRLVEEVETDFGEKVEKFNEAFELIQESNKEFIDGLVEQLEEYETAFDVMESKITELEDELEEIRGSSSEVSEKITEAVRRTELRMRSEADERIETLKENLVTSTEIFLEQELSEIKSDKEEMMKESQGRELLESIKGLVKQYWDIDSEVAEELLEMKKTAESKVEQYKDMLKREHSRLEESQSMVERLKKQVIVESKGSVLAGDKKRALEKLAENIESDKLESQIDDLMETVINTFNDGFSKSEVKTTVASKQALNESASKKVSTVISSGNSDKKEVKPSDELAELLEYAGIKR